MANAQAGRNVDILELARLVVPIRQDQGGTGATTAKQGLTNLIVNADGVPFKDTDYSGTLKQDTLTANRTWTLPDESGTIALTSQTGFRNLIINGNFNVNQRGYSSGTATTAANQYTLDRWYIETSGDDVTFAASGNGNEITIGSGVNFGQVVAGENILGGTYTLSWSGTATATVNGTAVANGDTVTLTANTDAKIVFTDGTLSQVQLEPGGMQTDFEQRLKSIEQTLCNYYFYAPALIFNPRLAGTIIANTASFQIHFPVLMRIIPNVNINDFTFANFSSNGALTGHQWGLQAANTTAINITGTPTISFQTDFAYAHLRVYGATFSGDGNELVGGDSFSFPTFDAEITPV